MVRSRRNIFGGVSSKRMECFLFLFSPLSIHPVDSSFHRIYSVMHNDKLYIEQLIYNNYNNDKKCQIYKRFSCKF